MSSFKRRSLGSGLLVGIVTCLGMLVVPARTAEPVPSDFADEKATWQIWCQAQIDRENGPVTFHPHEKVEGNDRYARVEAIEESLGGNAYDRTKCEPVDKPALSADAETADEFEADGAPDDLGPPVFEISPQALGLRDHPTVSSGETVTACPGTVWDPDSPSDKAYCTLQKVEFAKSRAGQGGEAMHPQKPVCMQRQEVRYHPANAASHHFYGKSRTYGIRFRLPEEGRICDRDNGLRWVNVQWKLKPLASGISGSPFLAQRFDNGYLFVTVQSGQCRCVVAAAEELKANFALQDGRPLLCQWTGPGSQDPACHIDRVNLDVRYGEKKWLDNTLGRWSEMEYRVKPHMEDGRIEISQGGELISVITGTIGYEPKSAATRVKFKFGQYRDYQPRAHKIEFDRIDLGAVSE